MSLKGNHAENINVTTEEIKYDKKAPLHLMKLDNYMKIISKLCIHSYTSKSYRCNSIPRIKYARPKLAPRATRHLEKYDTWFAVVIPVDNLR